MRRLIWFVRWDVARWMIHIAALWIAPPGAARDRVLSALWAAGNHMRETVALHRKHQQVMQRALRRSVRIISDDN